MARQCSVVDNPWYRIANRAHITNVCSRPSDNLYNLTTLPLSLNDGHSPNADLVTAPLQNKRILFSSASSPAASVAKPHFAITRHTLDTFPRYEIPTKTRFAYYCLISLHSVSLFQMRPLREETIAAGFLWFTIPAHLLWMAFPLFSVLRFYSINDYSVDANGHLLPRQVDPSPPTSYTIILAMTLVNLGQIAIWTRTYLGVPPTFPKDLSAVVQECTLHFAMAFWVLSEYEYMRAYWHSRLQEWPVKIVTLLKSILSANLDHTFIVSRDCCSYRRPCQYYVPPRDGWWSLEALCGIPLDLFYIISFHWVAMVCLLYPVERFADLGSKRDTFSIANQFTGVFFTPRWSWFMFLDLVLQRPVRLVNRMLFESTAKGVKRSRD